MLAAETLIRSLASIAAYWGISQLRAHDAEDDARVLSQILLRALCEAERIGLLSRVVSQERLLDECYAIAERIIGFSRVGVEVTKRMLWSSLDAASMHAHMDHEGIAQLYVRLTTQNFEEAIRARKQHRPPDFKD